MAYGLWQISFGNQSLIFPNTNTLPGQLQQRSQRKSGQWIAVVLLLALLSIALILGHSSALLWAELSWSDFLLLLRLGSLLVVLLVAIAGIYSLVSQFAFWEGWLNGLPRPAEFFAQANQELAESSGPAAVGVCCCGTPALALCPGCLAPSESDSSSLSSCGPDHVRSLSRV